MRRNGVQLVSTRELADLALPVLRGDQQASFGDGTGGWTATENVARELRVAGYDAGYGRTRRALEELERDGRGRRHPSGADYWQATTTRRRTA